MSTSRNIQIDLPPPHTEGTTATGTVWARFGRLHVSLLPTGAYRITHIAGLTDPGPYTDGACLIAAARWLEDRAAQSRKESQP